uniref:transposase n=1 Tax=Streptomyces sp. or43 TaxID=2478957 RepID=UPI0021CA3E24|nr:transposase [Streptomyces sp. or43]
MRQEGHHLRRGATAVVRNAGRTENCQVGVFAAYATTCGHALVDRELYVPKSWIDDPERFRTARIPANRPFATQNELARTMVLRAQAGPLPVAWVAADAAYGQDSRFRRFLEDAGLSYVVAMPKSQQVHGPRIEYLIGQAPAKLPPRHGSGSPAATAPKGLGSTTGLPAACRRPGSSTATSPPGNVGCLPAAASPGPTSSLTSSHPRPWTPPSPISCRLPGAAGRDRPASGYRSGQAVPARLRERCSQGVRSSSAMERHEADTHP